MELSSRILRPGDNLDLNATLLVPEELQQHPNPIWLDSLTLRLVASTTGFVGGTSRSHAGHIKILRTEGLLPLYGADNVFKLPPTLWNTYVYPAALPSFAACGIERAYCLELVAGLHSSLTSRVYVRSPAKLAFDIDANCLAQAIAARIHVVIESWTVALSDDTDVSEGIMSA